MISNNKCLYVQYMNTCANGEVVHAAIEGLNKMLRPQFALVKRDMSTPIGQPRFETAEAFTFSVLFAAFAREEEVRKIICDMGFVILSEATLTAPVRQLGITPLSAQLN